MDTNRLKMLCELNTANNPDNAAHRFGLTRTGLLKELHALEREAGMELIREEDGDIAITDEGRVMLPFAADLLKKEEDMLRQVVSNLASRKDGTGIVRIAAYSSQVIGWLPDALLKFMNDYPNYKVDVRVGAHQMEEWMKNNEVDVAILEKRLAANYHWTYLMRDEMMVAVPVSSPLSKMDAVPIERLEKHTVIFPTLQETNCVVMEMRRKKIHCEDLIPFRTEDGSILLSLVAKGFGISFLSENYKAECPDGVVMLPFKESVYRKLGIIYNTSGSFKVAAQVFADWIIKRFSEEETG